MTEFNKNKIFREENTLPDNNKSEFVKLIGTDGTSGIKNKITNNEEITQQDVLILKKELKKSKIKIFGQEMTKEEFDKIPERTINISSEILKGNMDKYSELTYLFPDVLTKIMIARKDIFIDFKNIPILTDDQAKLLSRYKGNLSLRGLVSISDNQTESLSKHEGALRLDDLTSINDNQAKSLSKHKGKLYLRGLVSISDNQTELLSKHKGDLFLNGLTSINDNQAESLSRHKEGLHLDGLTSINDNQAESLSRHKGVLCLRGLTSINDNQAESFSRYEWGLYLNGLTSLTNNQAKSLSRHNGDIDCNQEIKELINSYKTK